MGYAKSLLPPEAEIDERQPETISHVMNLEEAIHEFVRIQNRYAELAEEKKRVLEILIPAAIEAKREGSNTCRLQDHNDKVVIKAEFKKHVTCDVDILNEVREMVGDDKFEDLFKTEYSPKQRALKPFLATKTTDERIETAKEKIALALEFSPASPQFTIEKGQAETPMPWEH